MKEQTDTPEPQEARQETEDCKACSGTGGNVGPAGPCGPCEGRGYYWPSSSSPREPQQGDYEVMAHVVVRDGEVAFEKPQKDETPAQHIIDLAVQVSVESPCRSKRGAVLFAGIDVVSHGHNYKPEAFACDGSAACKATCRIEAIHAEQRALLAAGPRARCAAFLHVKTVDGALVPSGGPSCVQCSKLALAAGVTGMWLYHEAGWKWYAAEDWHRLSLLAKREPQEPHAALIGEIPVAVRSLERSARFWRAKSNGNESDPRHAQAEIDEENADLFRRCLLALKGARDDD